MYSLNYVAALIISAENTYTYVLNVHNVSSRCNPRFNTFKCQMIWCYPMFGDEPERTRRRKVHPTHEWGSNRANLTHSYTIANQLAQNW